MDPTTGIGIIVTGVLFTMVGLVGVFREAFAENTTPRFDVRAMLLCLAFGFMVIMAGHLTVQAAEESRDPVVFRVVGWYLVGAAVLIALDTGKLKPFAFLLALDSSMALRAGYAPAWGTWTSLVVEILPFAVVATPLLLRPLRSLGAETQAA